MSITAARSSTVATRSAGTSNSTLHGRYEASALPTGNTHTPLPSRSQTTSHRPLAVAGGLLGVANLAAGATLALEVSSGHLEWAWLTAPIAGGTLVFGGSILLRALRLNREGVDSIPLQLGPIAKLVTRATPSATDAGDTNMEIEHASLVQVLFVGVLVIAVLIATTTFPGRFPWQELVPAATMAWPALLRVHAARVRRATRDHAAKRVRDEICRSAIDRYA